MFFVLFFEPDRDTIYWVRKFLTLSAARSYLRRYEDFGSINAAVYSYDLQICYFKTF